MSAADDPAEPTPPAPAADDAYLAQALRLIIDAGIQLTNELVADRTTSAAEKVVAFERIARAVRRTILLLHSLARPAKRPAVAPRPSRRTRDADVAVANRAEPPEKPEAPERPERPERPESIAAELAFLKRPIPEIIAAIHRDLRPHRRRNPLRPTYPTHPRFHPRTEHHRANPPTCGPPQPEKRAQR